MNLHTAKCRRQPSDRRDDESALARGSGRSADLDIPPDNLETDPGPYEQIVAEIERSMDSKDEKDYVRDVAALIASIARNVERREVKELISNLTVAVCDASVVIHKIGNVTKIISIRNARREGLLQNEGFQRCTISDNAFRTVVKAPLYKKHVI